MSYFVDLEPDHVYYHDLILFFYKILINSDILFPYILEINPNVINKIMKISFDIENKDIIDFKSINTRLIMIKLLCKIIENITEDNLENLSKSIQNIENSNLIIQNPFIYLYEKILKDLNNDTKLLDSIIQKYYINLLFICLKNIYKFEKKEQYFISVINNINILNLLALSYNFEYATENKFVIQLNDSLFKNYEDIALYNSVVDKSLKEGKIICFLEDKFINTYNNWPLQHISNIFKKSTFLYDAKDKYKNALIIMKDFEQLEFYNISNFDIRNIYEFKIINTKNKYINDFIESNQKLIFNEIKEKLDKDKLNEKGLFLILKILLQLIKYLDKEELTFIIEYFTKLYDKSKSEENNYPFMSLDFIERNVNKYFEFHILKNIFKEKENDNLSFYSLFKYIIKDNILKISRNLEFINKSYIIFLSYPSIITNIIDNTNELKNVFMKSYILDNLSVYISLEGTNYEIINENSILFMKPILNDNDLLDLKSIVQKNMNKIKIIIVNQISNNVNQSDLIEFIINKNIPIYEIGNNTYQILYNFFIKGEGLNYINLYDDDSNFNKENFNIFSLFKLKFDKKYEDEDVNPIENIIKGTPDNILDKIRKNRFYKTEICRNYQNGWCSKGDNCNFAHGNEEKNKIKSIKQYLKNKNQSKDILKKYDTNRIRIYSELKDESINLFTILNIKLIKRLIFDIQSLDYIKLSEQENIFKNIMYIYESLCLEYYFNCKYNIATELLRKKLLNLFKKISNNNEIKLSENKWILYFFEQFEKIDYNQQIFQLNILDLQNLNNEKTLLDKFCYNPTILYDKFLFILEIINKEDNNENFINHYFNIINSILNNIINKNELLNNYQNNDDGYEYLILSKIMDILYNHYLNKLSINENISENNNKIIEKKSNIPNNIDETIKTLFTINLDDYFSKNTVKREDYFINRGGKKNMTKQTAFLVEFIFKYLDLCLILLLKENQAKFLEYMINPKNKLFKYYNDYKILTMEKPNKNKAYKEIGAFIYYIIKLISSNNIQINEIKENNIIMKLNANHFNEYKFKFKSDFYELTFQKKDNIDNKNNITSDFNKLVIFCFDDKTKKYYFQEIIDFNDYLTFDNTYKMRVHNDIYLIPLKTINTFLYSIENEKQSLNQDNASNNSKKLTKYENIPKYSWNIGYDGNNYLLLSEKDDKIYSFKEQKDYCELIKNDYKIDEKIENINKLNNKIIDFIDGIEECSSFAHRKDGEIFLLDEDKYKYKWLNDKEKHGYINYPIFINNVKIDHISASYYECYAIGKNGNLYEKNGANFIRIYPPQNTRRFLQCACGVYYVITLVENGEGKGEIYAKGLNNEYQCGIITFFEEYQLYYFSKCKIDDNLDFKYICTYKGFSSALTSCGKLYVWGIKTRFNNERLLIKTPILINENKVNPIIIDKISFNHNYLYAIGRKLENGNYLKKLFLLEDNKLYPSQKIPFVLKEINIEDKENNNSRIIPIKILVGQIRTYFLCINENELIKEYIQDVKENEVIDKVRILFSYKYQPKNQELNSEDMKDIYLSDKLIKFINSFSLFSDKNKKDLLKVFDGITRGDIKTNDIEYNEFIQYLKDKDEFKELLLFFLNNEKNEGKTLFDYLKRRISLIEQNILDYFYLNNYLKSQGYVQKIIENNITYLNDSFREQYFLSIFLYMVDSSIYKDYFKQDSTQIIKINRFKATNFKEEYNEKKIPDTYLNKTIFGQLFHSLGDLTAKKFLKDKGKKLFKVDLGEENAIDQGGPYSEILSDICDELQSDYIQLFIKTPNNKNNEGELRDRYIINPNCNNIIEKKAFEFIGKLMALAISSGETLNLNLHPIVWKGLLENEITFEDYKTIDINFYNRIEELKIDKSLISNYLEPKFAIQNLNGNEIELIDNGRNIDVTLENIDLYIETIQYKIMEELKDKIKYIKDGLYSAIEKNILQILNLEQFEVMVCGEIVFNIEDFKKHTTYDSKGELVIQWFWEWLKDCDEKDKFKYLKFVSSRSRLPRSEYKHEIVLSNDKNKFPAAKTCFSRLILPKYDSKEILYEKMKYVIENVTSITD